MKPWFRRRKGLFTKDLGWGYMPISWEGGLTIAVLLILIVGSVIYFQNNAIANLISLAVLIVIAILISDYTCDAPYIFKRK